MLLDEKRSATLKAIDQVELAVVRKDNLQGFHKTHEDISLKIWSEPLNRERARAHLVQLEK